MSLCYYGVAADCDVLNFVLFGIFEGAVGAPASVDMASGDLSLDRVVGDLGAVCTHAKDALTKSASTLGAV